MKETALVGAFSVITNLRIDHRFKLYGAVTEAAAELKWLQRNSLFNTSSGRQQRREERCCAAAGRWTIRAGGGIWWYVEQNTQVDTKSVHFIENCVNN